MAIRRSPGCTCCGCVDKTFAVMLADGDVVTETIPRREAAEIEVSSTDFAGSLEIWIHYEIDGAGDPIDGTGIKKTIVSNGVAGGPGIDSGFIPHLYYAPTWHMHNFPIITVNLDDPQPMPNGRIRITSAGVGTITVDYIDGTRTFESGYGGPLIEDCGGRPVRNCGQWDSIFTSVNAEAFFAGTPTHDSACFPPRLFQPWPFNNILPQPPDVPGNYGNSFNSCGSFYHEWSPPGCGQHLNAELFLHANVNRSPSSADPYPVPSFDLIASVGRFDVISSTIFSLPTEDIAGTYQVDHPPLGLSARWVIP